jgi:predicted nucleotidyltransferase
MIAHVDNPNLAILEMAVQALGDLTDSLVFVGGCATGLLVTRMRANQIRATEDVDVIAQAATIAEYHDVESTLASRGFKHDTSPDAPICRWLSGGITLDLMPSQPGVLSFHNRWYPLAVSTATSTALPSGRSIKLIAAPVFIATKLEAFNGRGNGDFLVSHDLEDIITVVDGRPALIEELRGAPEALRTYIATEIASLLDTPQFVDAVPGHLPGDAASQSRVPLVMTLLEALTQVLPGTRPA